MTTYNFHKHTNNEVHKWAIVEVVGLLTHKEVAQLDPNNIDVSLVIEGKEVNFLKFVDSFFAQIDHLVEDKVKTTIKERLGKSYDMLYEIEEYLQDKITALP